MLYWIAKYAQTDWRFLASGALGPAFKIGNRVNVSHLNTLAVFGAGLTQKAAPLSQRHALC